MQNDEKAGAARLAMSDLTGGFRVTFSHVPTSEVRFGPALLGFFLGTEQN